jgi:hypothetical protein
MDKRTKRIAWNKAWYEENKYTVKHRLMYAKTQAKKRKLSFELTQNVYGSIIAKPCHYCEADLSKSMGICLDRLNDELGYLESNVVPCCGSCNKGRNSLFTPQEWKVMITALKEWRKTQVPTLTPNVGSELFSKQS